MGSRGMSLVIKINLRVRFWRSYVIYVCMIIRH